MLSYDIVGQHDDAINLMRETLILLKSNKSYPPSVFQHWKRNLILNLKLNERYDEANEIESIEMNKNL